MPDIWNKIIEWIDHNRGVVFGLTLTLVLGAWLFGCQSKTSSVIDPTREVTRGQLNAEADMLQASITKRQAELEADVAAYSAALEASHAELDRQDALKQQIVEFAGGLATSAASGTFNPVQAITSAVSLGGLVVAGGALYDNRRKDKVIIASKSGA